jgi:hypothetical protein
MTHSHACLPSRWMWLPLTLILLMGCRRKESAEPVAQSTAEAQAPVSVAAVKPPTPPQDYVGSESCRECHAELCDVFHAHPMGRSLARTSDAPIEDYDDQTGFTTARGVRSSIELSYEIEQRNGEVLHHEIMRSGAGEVIYDLAVPVHYAVGSGQRGRSYLTNRDGLLFMSPITWYSQSGRWDLSPGYEHNNLHFGRRIVDGCLSCHAGHVAAAEDVPDRYESVPFFEESIGCEKCHGPGGTHVAFHLGDAENATDSIVNPARLPLQQRDHVCLQCHLIGEHRLTRYGRSDFDFRPGDKLTDVWTIFVKALDAGEAGQATEAVSQAEQMLSSVCYRQSGMALGCVSCHDPHTLPLPENRVEFYRSRCLSCHGPEQSECSLPAEERLNTSSEDSCIACHMPSAGARDVPHVSQTDHRILRDPQAVRTPREPSRQLQIFGMDDADIPEAELKRALAISLVRTAEQSGNAVLSADAIRPLESWVAMAPDDLPALLSLGVAHWLLEDPWKAAQVWEAGLKLSPDNESFLRRMFVLYHETGQFEQAAEFGRRLVRQNPWDYEYWGRQSHILGQLGEYEPSAQAAERALRLNPSAVQIHNWLANVYGLLEQPDQRAHHQREAQRKSE